MIYDLRSNGPRPEDYIAQLIGMFQQKQREKEEAQRYDMSLRTNIAAKVAPTDYSQLREYVEGQPDDIRKYFPQLPQLTPTLEQEIAEAELRAKGTSIEQLMADPGAYGQSGRYNLATGENPNERLTRDLTWQQQMSPEQLAQAYGIEGGYIEGENNAANNRRAILTNQADNARALQTNAADNAAQAGVRSAQQAAQQALAQKYGVEASGGQAGSGKMSPIDEKTFAYLSGQIQKAQEAIRSRQQLLGQKGDDVDDADGLRRQIAALQNEINATVPKLKAIMGKYGMQGGQVQPAAPAAQPQEFDYDPATGQLIPRR
jgi:hypothetical protein